MRRSCEQIGCRRTQPDCPHSERLRRCVQVRARASDRSGSQRQRGRDGRLGRRIDAVRLAEPAGALPVRVQVVDDVVVRPLSAMPLGTLS